MSSSSTHYEYRLAEPADPPDRLIEQALSVLRDEWREGWKGNRTPRAIRVLKRAQQGAPGHQLAMGLARVETMLGTYEDLSTDDRQELLKQAAAELKSLLPLTARSSESKNPSDPTRSRNDSAGSKPATRKPVKQVAVPQLPLEASVRELPKVGDAVAKRLEKLGVTTVGDLLRMAPRHHIDYSKTLTIRDAVGFGQRDFVTVKGTILDVTSFPGPPPRVTARLSDSTGVLRITWFNPYIAKQLDRGDEIAVSGAFEHGFGNPSVTNPEWERVDGSGLSTGRLTPVYHLTQGIAQKTLRTLTRVALDATKASVEDFLPAEIREEHQLVSLRDAFEHLHFPPTARDLEEAQRRLAFDEFFLHQLGLTHLKRQRADAGSVALEVHNESVDSFLSSLPFVLTDGQRRALNEVLTDLRRQQPMARLLQGDVGSGKTVVAAAAILVAVDNGYQAAVMAPTEILAEQHYQNFEKLFGGLPVGRRPTIGLLTGSTRARERREILARLDNGDIDLVVGTHALIQQSVDIPKLALAVVDEQHRFGVRQRADLPGRTDGAVPHLLSMTATPIPRTLNLVLNGDLDVSVISELPPGRVPIKTSRYSGDERERAYDLVREQVAAGRQVFVICPLVEESEALDARAAVAESERLQRDVFPELRVAVLHGRMSGKDKDRIMGEFRERKTDILVSTSVIEVGIDIPNATVMVIEGADRFGLAQLHQFRGRVGRGGHQSYCLLLADDPSRDAEQRLDMMVSSSDGFALAEKDLELRGPGDFLGVRQSGLPEMAAAIRGFDVRLLDAARRSAEETLARDPALSDPYLAALRDQAIEFWQKTALALTFS